MYKMNGIDLSSFEFGELEAMVDAYRSGVDLSLYNAGRLKVDLNGREGAYKADVFDAYDRLYREGMIIGQPDFWLRQGIYAFSPSSAGCNFVDDVRAEESASAETVRAERRHDYLVATLSASATFVLGYAGGFVPTILQLAGVISLQ